METVIKQTIRLGNSSGVILPKSWEYKKVRVELLEDSIARDIFDILRKKNLLREAVGIYLTGSYARGEETVESDVDVLVVTSKKNGFIKEGNYEITVISKEKLEQNLENSLYIYSMVMEARTIFNDELIKKYKEKRFELSVNKLIREIRSMTNVNKESVGLSSELDENVRDGIVYSVILRLREVFLIYCLLERRDYSRNDFLNVLKKKDLMNLYRAYLRIKNELKEKDNTRAENVMGAIGLIKDFIKKIENAKKK